MVVRAKVKQDDVAKALNLALRCLTAREYTKVELTTRLNRNFTASATQQAVEKCVAEGWQSDERYADMFLRHCLAAGYGPLKFKFDAKRKGLRDDLIKTTCEGAAWTEAACALLQRRCDDPASLDYLSKQKLLALLARRGFSGAQALSALNFLCSSADNGL